MDASDLIGNAYNSAIEHGLLTEEQADALGEDHDTMNGMIDEAFQALAQLRRAAGQPIAQS